MKKTPVIPGKPVVMKTREDEEQLVMDWVNTQSTYSDSIRYLIQKEIAENGIRNLQEFIPSFRTVEGLRALLANGSAPPPILQEAVEQQVSRLQLNAAIGTPSRDEVQVISSSTRNEHSVQRPMQAEQAAIVERHDSDSKIPTDSAIDSSISVENGKSQGAVHNEARQPSNNDAGHKRRAGKTFGAEVAKSYAN